jgi:hypothetical protein
MSYGSTPCSLHKAGKAFPELRIRAILLRHDTKTALDQFRSAIAPQALHVSLV